MLTIIIWMGIANTSFLRAVVAGLDRYTAKDKKYINAAITVTIKRFGPSGSLKDKNIVLEHTRDVIPKIINEVLFDTKYMSLIVLEIIEI